MSRANDLCPSIDAVLEQEAIGFDFGPELDPSVTITAIDSLTVTVEFGTDATPMARLTSAPQIIASPITGLAAQAVGVMFGTAVGGVTYRLQCVVTTSDQQHPSLWTDFACVAPF